MPGVKAITTCRECGAPRDPTRRLALCAEYYREYRQALNRKHGSSSKTQAQRLADAYDRLRALGLVEWRDGKARTIRLIGGH